MIKNVDFADFNSNLKDPIWATFNRKLNSISFSFKAIWLLCTGAREASFRNIKSIAECLADELVSMKKDPFQGPRVTNFTIFFSDQRCKGKL